MNFLAPLFLLASAAIAVPLWWHLIRRNPKERILFSATRFLAPSFPRITRRSRLEHLLLLALRCLAIALLACAFARPFLTQPLPSISSPATSRHVVVLVDTSASMRRPGLWPAAIDAVQKTLNDLSAGDAAAVYTFDSVPIPLITFDEWNRSIPSQRAPQTLDRLQAIHPGWDRTETASALIQASHQLRDVGSTGPQTHIKEIVLITDFQESSRLGELRGARWPDDVRVSIKILKPDYQGNASLTAIVSQELGVAREKRVKVRGHNSSETKTDRFQTEWIEPSPNKRSLGTPSDISVPPGQSRPLAMLPTANTKKPIELHLSGDNSEFDNTFYLAPTPIEETLVTFVGGADKTASSTLLFYLGSVFQTNAVPSVNLRQFPSQSTAGAAGVQSDWPKSPVIAALPADPAGLLHLSSSLDAGATAFAAMLSDQAGPQLAQLTQQSAFYVREDRSKSYQMLAEIDFSHPLFKPMSDSRFNDFTKVHFWRHRVLQPTNFAGARVIARFENNNPALLELPTQRGRLFLLTSSWTPDDSQLALSSKFVPLMYAFLDSAGVLSSKPSQTIIGSPIDIGSPVNPGSVQTRAVRRPDGRTDLLGSAESYTKTEVPGFYKFEPENRWVGVNVAPDESKTKPMEKGDLEKFGIKVVDGSIKQAGPQNEPQRRVIHAQSLESQQRLWRWFLLAALAVLVLETFLARRMSLQPALASE